MDALDLKIVQELDKNSRDSFGAIGVRLGASARTVQRRVLNMVRIGFIRSFEVTVDPTSLDLGEAVCDIQLKTNATNDDVRNRLLRIPSVHEVISLAGGNFVAYVYYRDSGELENILDRLNVTEGVADVQYELNPRTSGQIPEMSRQSWLLIHLLNHKARREFGDVSKEAGLSARTVQRNVKWLTSNSLIRFGVDVDVSRAENLFVYVLVVRVQPGTAKLKVLAEARNSVNSIWRELKSVNPYTFILLLHAAQTTQLERHVEKLRLLAGVAGVRVLFIIGDMRNTQLADSLIAERAGRGMGRKG
jgi:DNA-binding Lrp family transcriptional regulator